MNFVALNTVIPVYVKKIGGTNLAVGLIPVVWVIGFHLPQIFTANYVRRQQSKKKVVMLTALMQRLPWLLLSILSFLIIYKIDANLGLIVFFLGFLLASVGGGMNLPAWFDLLTKITPTHIRGRLFAFRVTLGAVMGIFAGYAAKQVLDNIQYPANFSLLFGIAFLMMMISYLFLVLLKEEKVNTAAKSIHWKEFLKSLPHILKSQVNYRNYLIADVLMILAGMANAFYTVYAFEKFNLTSGYAGDFTIVMMIATVFASLVFGLLADRYGHRINLFFGALFTFIACILAIFIQTLELYYSVFVFSAMTIALIQVSRITIVAELSPQEETSTYVSLSNVITVPFVLSGIFAGWLADIYGYIPVFVIAGIFAALSAFWFLFIVKEPRFHGISN
ncbi:MAG: MFS transporter [Melioribacteraceae bacterium]|nr:MFS transporter [Melioribacteraceae bacterium]MCF8265970.1 MFS transporter [Melioribacteraceae bacterium]